MGETRNRYCLEHGALHLLPRKCKRQVTCIRSSTLYCPTGLAPIPLPIIHPDARNPKYMGTGNEHTGPVIRSEPVQDSGR